MVAANGVPVHRNTDAIGNANPFISAAAVWAYSGTVSLNWNYNVASVSRQSEGVFRHTFTNSMATVHYVAVGSVIAAGGNAVYTTVHANSKATGYVDMNFAQGTSQIDPSNAMTLVFGAPSSGW